VGSADDGTHVLWLQVCILDGNRYNKLCREAGEQRLDILDECEVRLLAAQCLCALDKAFFPAPLSPRGGGGAQIYIRKCYQISVRYR